MAGTWTNRATGQASWPVDGPDCSPDSPLPMSLAAFGGAGRKEQAQSVNKPPRPLHF